MRKIIYDFFSNEVDSNGDYYNIGTFEEFEKDMQNPDARREFYDFFSNEVDENGDYYNLGTFAEFEQDIARSTAKEIGKISAQATGQATKEQPKVAHPVTAVQASDRANPFYTKEAYMEWLARQPKSATKQANQELTSGQVTETPTAPSAPKAEDISITKATATTAEVPKVETTANPVSALHKADGTPYSAEELQGRASQQQAESTEQVAEQPTVQVESVDESLVTPTETDQAKLEAKATKAEGDQKAEDGDKSWEEYKAKLKDLYGGMNIPEASQVDNSIGIKFTEEAPYNIYAGQYIEYAERMVLQKLHEIAIKQNGGQPLSNAQLIDITNQAKSMSEKDVQKVLGAEGLEALRKTKEQMISWEKRDQRNAHAINNLLTDPDIANYLKRFGDGKSLAEVAQNAVVGSEVELGQMNAEDAKKYIGARMAKVDYLLGDDAMQYYLRNINNNNEQTKQKKAQAILSTAMAVNDLLYSGLGLPEKAKTYARNALTTAVKNGQIGTTDGNAVVNDVLERVRDFGIIAQELLPEDKEMLFGKLQKFLDGRHKITSLEDVAFGDEYYWDIFKGNAIQILQYRGKIINLGDAKKSAEDKRNQRKTELNAELKGKGKYGPMEEIHRRTEKFRDVELDLYDRTIEYLNDADVLLNDSNATGASGFISGLKTTLADKDSWTFGLTDLAKANTLRRVIDKYARYDAGEKGVEMTDAELAFLDAFVTYTAAEALTDPSLAYKVGAGVGASIPYIIEMALTPSAPGRFLAQTIFKYAKSRGLGKIAKVVAKGVGGAVNSLTQALIFAPARMATAVVENDTPKLKATKDESDIIHVDGIEQPDPDEEKKSNIRVASEVFYEQAMGAWIERAGGDILKFLGSPTAKVFSWLKGKGISMPKNSSWNQILQRVHFNGMGGEFAEEILNQIAMLPVSDQTFNTNEKTGIFSTNNLTEVFLTTTVLSSILHAPNAVIYKTEAGKLSKEIEFLEDLLKDALGDEFDEIKEAIYNATINDMSNIMKEVARDKKRTTKEKKDILSYISKVAIEKELATRWEGEQMSRDNNAPIKAQEEIENATNEGMNIKTTGDSRESQVREELTGKSLAETFGTNSTTEAEQALFQRYGTNDVSEIAISVATDAELSKEQKGVIQDYLKAKAMNIAKFSKVQADAQQARRDATQKVDDKTHSDGAIYQAELNNGKTAHIIVGEIEVDNKGNLAINKGEDNIIIVNEDNEKELASPKDVVSIARYNAEDVKNEALSEVDAEWTKNLGVAYGEHSVGDVVTLRTYNGEEQGYSNTNVTIVRESQGADGTIVIECVTEDGSTLALSKDDFYKMADGAIEERIAPTVKKAEVVKPKEQSTQAEPTQEQAPITQVTEQAPQVESAEVVEESTEQPMALEPGAMVSLADGSVGEVVSMPEDGKVIIEHEDGSTNEYNVGDLKVAEKPSAQTPQAPTVPQVESTPVVEQTTESAQQVESTATPIAQVEIPTDEKGKKVYEQAPIEATINDIYNDPELDEEEADAYVQAKIDGATKRVEAIDKKKPKMGEDRDAYVAQRDAWRAERDAEQSKLDYWQGVQAQRAQGKANAPKSSLRTNEPTGATPSANVSSAPSPKMDTPKAEPTAPPMESKPKAEPIKVGTKHNAKGQVIGLIDNPVAQVLNNTSRATFNKLGEAMGVAIHIVPHLEGANAKIEGDRITVAIDAEQGPLKALGHELLHRIKSLSPKAYEDFADVVEKIVPSFQARMVATRLTYANAGRKIDMKLLREEVVADLAGDIMVDAELMERFVEKTEGKEWYWQIWDTIKNLIEVVESVFRGQDYRNFVKAKRVLLKAMQTASREYIETYGVREEEFLANKNESKDFVENHSPNAESKENLDNFAEELKTKENERRNQEVAEIERQPIDGIGERSSSVLSREQTDNNRGNGRIEERHKRTDGGRSDSNDIASQTPSKETEIQPRDGRIQRARIEGNTREERVKNAVQSGLFDGQLQAYGLTHTLEDVAPNGVGIYVDHNGEPSLYIASNTEANPSYVAVFKDKSGQWTSKMENSTGSKEFFKGMISDVMNALPEGAELIEHTSASVDGLRTLANQLKHGFVATGETYTCGLNAADIGGVLGIRDNGDFNSISWRHDEVEQLRDILEPYLAALGMPRESVNTRKNPRPKGKVEITLPVLKKNYPQIIPDHQTNSATEKLSIIGGRGASALDAMKKTNKVASEANRESIERRSLKDDFFSDNTSPRDYKQVDSSLEKGKTYSIDKVKELFYKYNTNEEQRKLADRVFEVASNLGIKVDFLRGDLGFGLGGRVSGDVMEIARITTLERNIDKLPDVLLHESIHAVTVYAMDAYTNHELTNPILKEAVEEIKEVYKQISSNESLKGEYGLKNEKELVAEMANPKFRNKLKAINLWDKLKDAIKKIFLGRSSISADEVLSDALDKILDNFDINLYEEYSRTQEIDNSNWDFVELGQSTDIEKGVVDINEEQGQALFSLRTYNEGGRESLQDFVATQVDKGALTQNQAQEIVEEMETIYDICEKYTGEYTPFGNWSEAEVVLDERGVPVLSVIKTNGDYKMNLDFSLVCKKRRTLDAVFQEMINRGVISNFELGQVDIARINDIIREHGFETACRLCFVDSKRFRTPKVADDFANLYNELVEMSDAQLKKVIKGEKKNTVRKKASKHLLAHPEDRIKVGRDNFITAQGFEQMKKERPQILSLYNMAKGSGGPKASFGDVQYMNDVQNTNWTPEKAYAVGGVRLQSFSDYVPRMVFDYVQLLADLSAKQLPVHAYTKEPIFAKQFGLSGIKINLSLVPRVDADGVAPGLDKDGNYAWQDGESFPYDIAVELQNAEGYKENVGTIAVGVSDEHIAKLLDDPNIRMVIPYHKSGLNKQVAIKNNIDAFVDYTNIQNTRHADGKKVAKAGLKGMPDFNQDIHKGMHPREAAQRYLDWCDKKGYLPKFDQFRDHPNYYKMLEDFTTIIEENGEERVVPQGAVSMTFPTENDAFGSMESLIKEGLEEDAILEGNRQAKVGEIVDEIEDALADTKYSLRSNSQEVADIVSKAKADGTYMKAPNGEPTNLTEEQWANVRTKAFKDWFGDWENDPENASKVVDENGEPKVVYHQTNHTIYRNIETGENWDDLDWREKQEWEERDDWEDYWHEEEFYEFNRANARATVEFDGFFFAPEYDEYHGYGERTIEAFLNIRKPASREDYHIDAQYNDAGRKERIRLQEEGYDGVIRGEDGVVDEYVAFEPNQIKSATDNVGTYSSEDNDIRYSLRGTTDAQTMENVMGEMMDNNPKGWGSIKDKLRGTPIWNEVVNDEEFADVREDEDVITGEALSRLRVSIDGLAQQITDNAKGVFEKAEAVAMVDRMHRALSEFNMWVDNEDIKIVDAEPLAETTEGEEGVKYSLRIGGVDLNNIKDTTNGRKVIATTRGGHKQVFKSVYNHAVDLFGADNVDYETAKSGSIYMTADLPNGHYAEIRFASHTPSGQSDFELEYGAMIHGIRWTYINGAIGAKIDISYNNMISKDLNSLLDMLNDYAQNGFPEEVVNELKASPYNHSEVEISKGMGIEFEQEGETKFSLRGGGVLHPQGDDYDGTRKKYNDKVKSFGYKMREGYQDSMLALKELQKIVAKANGKKVEDIPSWQNAYINENLMSSKNKAQHDAYVRDYYKPLINVVKKLIKKGGMKYDDIKQYLIAKHGLERNEKMAIQEAKKVADNAIYKREQDAKNWARIKANQAVEGVDFVDDVARNEAWKQVFDEVYKRETFTSEEEKQATWDKVFNKQMKQNRNRDYSGLTAMFGVENVHEAEKMARELVDKVEQPTGKMDELWNAIRSATEETLATQYKAGLLSRDEYEKIRDMYEYYVPLRGFDKKTADEEYEYLVSKKPILQAMNAKAMGRSSLADDPLATIGAMADSAIIQSNRNKMKQAFYHFVKNNPSALVTESEQWYVQDGEGHWVATQPNIPANATSADIEEAIAEHEERMKALKKEGKARTKPNTLDTNFITLPGQAVEHMVKVKINGKEKVLYINGNPRAAQAVNGLTNPEAFNDVIRDFGKVVNNYMAQVFTSKNPAFIFTNGARDLQWAANAVMVKEGWKYQKQYAKNIGKASQVAKYILKYNNGTLELDDETQRYFNEFISSGGETGYTAINQLDHYKKEIAKMIKGVSKVNPMTTINGVLDSIEYLNRSVEDITRFAVFMTSRQMGRSLQQSAYDAKEITVNFNKKGSGIMGARYLGAFYIFLNASLQSINNLCRIVKHHPIKATIKFAEIGAVAYALPMLNELLIEAWGDDDDKEAYANLPEWVKKNNVVVYIPDTDGMFFTIPMSHEMRPFATIGYVAHKVMNEGYDAKEGMKDIISAFGDMLPIEITGNDGNMAVNLTPTFLQPIAQLIANTDYFGKPIYRDADYTELKPEYTTAFRGTSPILIDASKYINEISGGDAGAKGKADGMITNPDVLEHLIESYFGGLGKLVNKGVKSITAIWDEQLREVRNIPIASNFVAGSEERTSTGFKQSEEYYALIDEYKKYESKSSLYKEEVLKGARPNATTEEKMNSLEYANKLTELMTSPETKRYITIKGYKNYVDALNKGLENVDITRRADVEKMLNELKKELISEVDKAENKDVKELTKRNEKFKNDAKKILKDANPSTGQAQDKAYLTNSRMVKDLNEAVSENNVGKFREWVDKFIKDKHK